MNAPTIGPTNPESFRVLVRSAAAKECRICAICALSCGAVKPVRYGDKSMFTTAECPGCGRRTGVTEIGNWEFGDG